jgi:hypothetical protein
MVFGWGKDKGGSTGDEEKVTKAAGLFGPEGKFMLWAAKHKLNKEANKQQTLDSRGSRRDLAKTLRQRKREARSQKRIEGEWGIRTLLILISLISLFIMRFLPDNLKVVWLVVVCIALFLIARHAVIEWEGVAFVLFMILAFWFIYYTPWGDLTMNKIEVALPGVSEQVDDVGIEHQFNVIGQILSGEFEPEKLWTSEAVKSEYAVPEEFEFFLTDVSPRKEFFESDEDIYLQGNINLVSGFDKTTTVELGVEPTDFCAKESEKAWNEYDSNNPLVNSLLDLTNLGGDSDDEDFLKGCSDGTEWQCFITGSDQINTFQMKRIYNRMFYCEHTGIEVSEEEVISSLEVTWEYSTSAVAGMQVYAFNTETLNRNPGDPLDRYDIDKDSLISWYIGDERVNLGIGLSGTPNKYVRAEVKGDLFEDVNYLAISIKNIGGGDITEIESLSVSFPNTPEVHVANSISKVDKSYLTFIGPTTEVITILGSDVVTKKFTLSNIELLSFEEIGAAEGTSYYIPFVVDEAYVGDTDFRSFLVKADIRYKYKDGESVPVIVKPKKSPVVTS